MRLKSIAYSQFKGKPEEWRIDNLSLGDINLLIGKNATGKSKVLSIISSLANLISGDAKLQYRSGDYKVLFDLCGKEFIYILKYEKSEVVKEKLKIDSKTVLDRGIGGVGKIYAVEENKNIKFQAPVSELACFIRRDEVQHPFFEELYKWGKLMRLYHFGSPLGKDFFLVLSEEEKEGKLDLKDPNKVVAIFRKGIQKYKDAFLHSINSDMSLIGYELDEVRVGRPTSITFKGGLHQIPQGLLVKERDLKGVTDQHQISQGMFRALSLIIQLNYSQLASIPSCILIDDIGEGLDYDRSTALIKLLIEKAKASSVQLIMSTNDRFVMNNVPLKYWCVIRRMANTSKIYNYDNAREKFDEFELTGLNNFDFFSSGFFEGDNKKK